MKNESRITVSHPAIVYSLAKAAWMEARQRWHLLLLCQLPTSVVWATINAGTTTVTSIGHSFEPEDPTPDTGHPAVVTDFLVNQTQEVGGGAVLPAVTVNLDVDTSISYTIAAPAGEKFVIHVPAGSVGEHVAVAGLADGSVRFWYFRGIQRQLSESGRRGAKLSEQLDRRGQQPVF